MNHVELVEKVARAICKAQGDDPDLMVSSDFSGRGTSILITDGYLTLAGAAIAAVAEALEGPSVQMLRSGQDAWVGDNMHRSSTLYRAMIAASALYPEEK